MLTWEQQEQNWINLEPQIKQYFNNLATSDPNRTGQAFFEDTIPENIQSYPQAVTDILNGNDALNIADKWWYLRQALGADRTPVAEVQLQL